MNNSLKAINFLAKISKKICFVIVLMLLIAVSCSYFGDSHFVYTPNKLIINDITGLNPINVSQVITPTSVEEIVQAIKNSQGAISIGGGRYSQGGQTAYLNSLHFDMRNFNKIINLDVKKQEIIVQAGITWRDIQQYIDDKNLSIKIMQTYANFTVGGSLSVNVHGRYVGEGPIVYSVNRIKLVLADGEIISASPEQNSEIFYAAIGGYGGIGVIVEANLQLTNNSKVIRKTQSMPASQYHQYFVKNIENNPEVVFTNADLYPPNYDTVLDVSWYQTDKNLTITDRLRATDTEYNWQPKAANFIANYDFGKTIRQHIIDPIVYTSEPVVWRNWEASYDVRELEPNSRIATTFALREYFIPVENFDAFIPKMKAIFKTHKANILNVSIRHAKPDHNTLLSWANTEVFAFVVYYRQGTDEVAKEQVKSWSLAMIDEVIAQGGSYYLPYQILASTEQFLQAYPRAKDYFALKMKVDPNYRFRNALWKKHYPQEYNNDQGQQFAEKVQLKQYFRQESQTLLTIPEWYLVFNPLEYANYLASGHNPSNFPFMASINEYWSLYDRVTAISNAEGYPVNDEYITMLKVIGVSTTVEFMVKAGYENTIGRLTRWLANNEDTAEDKIITQAHRAYSQLIFHEAWYEFDFWAHVIKIWSQPDFFANNFIRKTERKIFFTLEFGFKTLYAKLIELGAKSAYEESEGVIYLTASHDSFEAQNLPQQITIINKTAESYLLSLPRWGGFTETVPKLVKQGFKFTDISGNQRIAVSILSPITEHTSYPYAAKLFTSVLLTDDKIVRNVYWLNIKDLHQFINDVNHSADTLEHIYDY